MGDRCVCCMGNRNVDPNTRLCERCHINIMKKIEDYLDEHKGADKKEISKATKINITIINALIESGSLEYIMNPNKKKVCKKCKNEFSSSGDYCEECSKSLGTISQLQQLYTEKKEKLVEEKKKQSAKMHTTIKF